MSMRWMLLLFFVLSVSAERNVPLPFMKLLCAQCKMFEPAVKEVISQALKQGDAKIEALEQGCTAMPSPLNATCEAVVSEYKEAMDDAGSQVVAQSPCKAILGCDDEGEPPYDYDFINEGGLCGFCEATVQSIFDKVGVEDLIKKGADRIIELCEELGLVGDDDCKKRVRKVVKEVEVPLPKEVCQIIGVCDGKPLVY